MIIGDNDAFIKDFVQQVAIQKGISYEQALHLLIDALDQDHDQKNAKGRKAMLIKELAAMIHRNAVDHGWWDEARELPELVALIHSEWSEALEEARAGRPMVYRLCADCDDGPCAVEPDDVTRCGFKAEGRKPEGIAVELIDGCIRILDLLGHQGVDLLDPDTGEPSSIGDLIGKRAAAMPEELPKDVLTLVSWLHVFTSQTMLDADEKETPEVYLVAAMSIALSWVQTQGIDPIRLLLEKHEYNKGRPYKHGKKF